ncbi:hypothetical protein N7G274_000571 [Stereocaulon virgatum]|uniref:Transposase n=1 Tax=Stereocaulon virgatum TaxID=373712 RepID=A0ABR4ASI1_9LECA
MPAPADALCIDSTQIPARNTLFVKRIVKARKDWTFNAEKLRWIEDPQCTVSDQGEVNKSYTYRVTRRSAPRKWSKQIRTLGLKQCPQYADSQQFCNRSCF